MPAVTVADTSCLILLEKIGELDVLEKLYGSITITPDVAAEYNAQLPHWISVHSPSDKRRVSLLQLTLDTGEASAIALAMELENALLIIDELKGRNVAKRLKLRYTGTLGILVEAKRRGHLSQLKPILEKVKATDFRISPSLELAILKRAGEI